MLLKCFVEDDDREIRRDLVNRVRAPNPDRLDCRAGHGRRTGSTRLAHPPAYRRPGRNMERVGNWRITFTLDSGEICNLNLEDYH